jgi:hypothetical protein
MAIAACVSRLFSRLNAKEMAAATSSSSLSDNFFADLVPFLRVNQ